VNPKQLAGERAVEHVESGMVVGLGTGSTAYFAIRKLGERVRAGLSVRGVPTSEQSRAQAADEGIPLVGFDQVAQIDLTIDGADEVDPAFNLIKGGGGALLREKIVATASTREIVVADESKQVGRLGAFALPVETVPFGWQVTAKRLKAIGCRPSLRGAGADEPFVTDNGNYVIDCDFGRIDDPAGLEARIEDVCGVVACGLFTGLVDSVIVGYENGTVVELTEPRPLTLASRTH
jgi:ribose 5-phosphate isomerase A